MHSSLSSQDPLGFWNFPECNLNLRASLLNTVPPPIVSLELGTKPSPVRNPLFCLNQQGQVFSALRGHGVATFKNSLFFGIAGV